MPVSAELRIREALNHSYRVLGVCTAGAIVLFYQRAFFSAIAPIIQREFGLTYTQIGLVPTSQLAAGALGYALASYLIYRFGCRRVFALGFVLTTAAVFLTSVSQDYLQIVLFLGIQGLCVGPFYLSAIIVLSNFSVRSLGKSMGIVEAGVNTGVLTALGTAGLMAMTLSWRLSYCLVAIPGIFIAISALTFIRREGKFAEPVKKVYGAVLHNVHLWLLAGLLVVFFAEWHSIWSFVPTYLVKIKGLSLPFAGLLSALSLAIGVPAAVFAGWLADRINPKTVSSLYFVILAGALMLTGLANALWQTLLALIVLSWILLGGVPVIVKIGSSQFPSKMQTSAYGVVFAIGFGGGAMGPAIFGYVADVASFEWSFFFLAGLSLLGFLLSTRTRNP